MVKASNRESAGLGPGVSARRGEVTGRLTAAMVLWVHAAERQRDRVVDRSAEKSHRITDAVFFVIALRNVRLSLERLVALDAAPGYAAAIQAIFDESVPSVTDIRHALEHYDEYVLGAGRGQKAGRFSEWSFGLEDIEDDVVFRLGELSLNIGKAYAAAVKAFQQLFVVFEEILKWPEDAQRLD